jgi:hypothetical protein
MRIYRLASTILPISSPYLLISSTVPQSAGTAHPKEGCLVVMHRSHSHHAARILQAQPIGHLQGIVVPIPDEDIGLIQLLGHLARGFSIQREGTGRHPFLQPFGIGDAIHRYTRRLHQNVQQRPAQLELVGADGRHALFELQPPSRIIGGIALEVLCPESLAHPFEVLQRSQHPAHAFEVARASLELARRVIRRRAYLVGSEPVEQVVLPVQHPHVWPEEFVL